ncbi:MAG: GntR family transcriptional regulator [Burkholderiaceae bacterium]|nr:MAG: GntR family transcriptional regulator [Burkholderiaceae bacterium]
MPVASDKAYELLKQRLIGGGYAPGAQLKEEHLARELDISRTPVRVALKRLVQDGLATAEAGRGVRVAEWTESDIQETYHLRSLLEGHAAELATQRGGPALAARLQQLNEQMEAAIAKGGSGMAARMQEINSAFHRAILEASGSPRLRTLLATLIDMPVVTRSFFISTPQDMAQSLQHHRDLAAAVAVGDEELARSVMQLHLRVASHRFRQRRSEFSARDSQQAVRRRALP